MPKSDKNAASIEEPKERSPLPAVPSGAVWNDPFKVRSHFPPSDAISSRKLEITRRNRSVTAPALSTDRKQVLDSLTLQRLRDRVESLRLNQDSNLREFLHPQLAFLFALEASAKTSLDLRSQAGKVATAFSLLFESHRDLPAVQDLVLTAHRALLRYLPYRVSLSSREEPLPLLENVCQELLRKVSKAREES